MTEALIVDVTITLGRRGAVQLAPFSIYNLFAFLRKDENGRFVEVVAVVFTARSQIRSSRYDDQNSSQSQFLSDYHISMLTHCSYKSCPCVSPTCAKT